MGNYCVYKHTSPSGKVYIGITSQKPESRWGNGKNYRYNIRFTNAIVKYGWDNIKHEIMREGLSQNEANEVEQLLIAQYKSTESKYGYNITRGGDARFCGENHPLYGKKRPPEVLAKMSAARKGKPLSNVHREAIRKYYATHKNHNFGKKASLETREKLRLSHLGQCRSHTEETIRKISEGNARFRKPVLQFTLDGELIAEHESINDAARSLVFDKRHKENIRQCCHNLRKSAYGFRWKFAEEVDAECTTFS